jgi:hypothetical protein
MAVAGRGRLFVNVGGRASLRRSVYCNVQIASWSHLALCLEHRVRGHEIENGRSLPSVAELKETLKIYLYSSNVAMTVYVISILKQRHY